MTPTRDLLRRSNFVTLVCLFVIISFVLGDSATETSKKTEKSVNTIIQARWPSFPLHIEASEYFSEDDNGDAFWIFAESLTPDLLTSAATDEQRYEKFLSVIREHRLLSETRLKHLEMGLALHIYSPKIEMYQQLARLVSSALERKAPEEAAKAKNCQQWSLVNGKVACNVAELSKLLSDSKTNTTTKQQHQRNAEDEEEVAYRVYEFDHVYRKGDVTASDCRDAVRKCRVPTVFLYATLGTKEFFEFHKFLSQKSKDAEIHYIFRHYINRPLRAQPQLLQGYAAELQLKNIEYKVIDVQQLPQDTQFDENEPEISGFFFGRLRKRYPEVALELSNFREYLKSDERDFTLLKVWELKELGIQAAQKVMTAENPLATLRDVSSNLPSLARPLARQKLNETIRIAMQQNAKYFDSENSFVSLNGRLIEPTTIDPFALYEQLTTEIKKVDELSELHISQRDIFRVLNVPFTREVFFKVNVSSDEVLWLNDLENDKTYKNWPRGIQNFFNPTFFPQQAPFIAKNFFTVVALLNPTSLSSINAAFQLATMVWQQQPIRVGFLFTKTKLSVDSTPEQQHEYDVNFNTTAKYWKFLHEKSKNSMMNYFQQMITLANNNRNISDVARQAFLRVVHRRYDPAEALTDTSIDDWLHQMEVTLKAKRLHDVNPMIFINGWILPDIDEPIMNIGKYIATQKRIISSFILEGKIKQDTDIYKFMLEQKDVLSRFSPLVFPSEDNPLHFVPLFHSKSKSLLANVKYFVSPNTVDMLKPITHHLAVDLTSESGRHLLSEALRILVSNNESEVANETVRIGVINTKLSDIEDNVLARSLRAILLSYKMKDILPLVRTLLNLTTDQITLSNIERVIVDAGLNFTEFHEKFASPDIIEQLKAEALWSQQYLSLKLGDSAVITNGRMIVVPRGEQFDAGDFELLRLVEYTLRAAPIHQLLDNIQFVGVATENITSDFYSDIIQYVVPILHVDSEEPRHQVKLPPDIQPSISVTSERPVLQIQVFVNPLSSAAQRFTPILLFLMEYFEMDLTVYLIPNPALSTMPLQNYYRVVLNPIQFDKDGKLYQNSVASFSSFIPQTRLLTLNIHPPPSWLVGAINCSYDLDNLILKELPKTESGVNAVYELENILIEGSCGDLSSRGMPPRGLELFLGDYDNIHYVDTMVMSNLGYFQLKANPGVWLLSLAPNTRSSEVYQIVDDSNTTAGIKEKVVIVSSFSGSQLALKVRKLPGKEDEKLFDESKTNVGQHHSGFNAAWTLFGLWGSETVEEWEERGQNQSDTTIHIYSLASGHLYERFLKVMILSLIKHTTKPVKFWLLKNFLSPKFKEFIPKMAKAYNFSVELITFKWPAWLHKQTEKQRIIWGYKILFLDVLFPLSVKKIIYVDADQIVRADINELWTMNLEGKVYGYTPFCSGEWMREETKGFRFWESGYWKEHLQGRPYHISALYVVDLERLRASGVGDTLRSQYMLLSQDPDSLANLDQDLPNYLQPVVPIYSLPQEWLWCQTWCTDETRTKAKTIDLVLYLSCVYFCFL
jgi:UDP-glucose:glycoprotein glucosyltransferase